MAVSFLLTNSYEFIVVFFAVLAQRAVANPLNPNYTVDEILFYLQDVQPSAVVVCRGAANVATVGKAAERAQIPMYEVSLHKAVQHVLARTDIPSTRLCPPGLQASPSAAAKTGADPAMVQQVETTITTYRLDMSPTRLPPAITVPPAVALGVDRNHRSIHPTYSPDDIALFLHTSGTTGRPKGGTVIVPPKFSVTNFWPDFIGLGATWYSAVPTIHQMLLLKTDVTYPGHSGALRFIRSCSSSLAPTTMLQLERRFQAPVIEAYAMTEAAHQMTANFLPPGMRKPGSVGKGRGVNVQVFDASGQPVTGHKAIGEICVNAPNVFSGYHNNPTATAESFYYDTKRVAWFRTGDLGFQDENKFVVLVGRIKEQINRGGEKISPVEIDQLLLQHPTVAEPSEADLKAFLSKSIAAFKVPRTIHIVDQILKLPQEKFNVVLFQIFQKQSTKSAKL
ncbi:4-coumarate-CoA ligase-like 10 [Batrachochytrium salamandrivorans]|nr:4-coumarate-CoA ligase-like 10 [Batrachochytrium salamandrivorans]